MRREQYGSFSQLMSELQVEDPAQFCNFFRMKPLHFEILVCKITLLVAKQDILFKAAFSVLERLALT